jgi:RHS repeat-associated protein
VAIKSGGTNYATFKYDSLGRRIQEGIGYLGATWMYYAGWNLVDAYNSTPTVDEENVWSPIAPDTLIETNRDIGNTGHLNTLVYVQQDANQDVTAVINTSGAVQERYVYDPYGAYTILTANWATRGTSITNSVVDMEYLYQGLRANDNGGAAGTFTFDERGRIYFPDLGRFGQPDPIGFGGGQTNLYERTGDQPVNGRDPSGMLPIPEGTLHEGSRGKWEYTAGIRKEGARYEYSMSIVVTPPRRLCDCTDIRFIQIVRVTDPKTGRAVPKLTSKPEDDKVYRARMTNDGWFIDSKPGKSTGWYGRGAGFATQWGNTQPNADTLKDAEEKDQDAVANGMLKAFIYDAPSNSITNAHFEFVSVAVCNAGRDKGEIIGAVSWGFTVNNAGKLTPDKVKFSYSAPPAFEKAIFAWNWQAAHLGPTERNAADQVDLPHFRESSAGQWGTSR